jgi:hypothetical protein
MSDQEFTSREQNRYIYETMLRVFAEREPGEKLFDPDSPVAEISQIAFNAFSILEIEKKRAGVVSAIANIDLFNARQSLRRARPEDFHA